MILLGCDVWQANCYDTIINSKNLNYMEVLNAKFDEIYISESISPFSTNKKDWDVWTIFLAKFQNNLDAGNLGNLKGFGVTKLRIKRRRKGEFKWDTIEDISYDIKTRDYSILDKYVEALEDYEYTVVPLLSNNIEGNIINVSEICPEFEGSFLMDKFSTYAMLYDIEYGNVQRVQKEEYIETIGSRYPIANTNATIDYEMGTFKAKILSDSFCGDYIVEAKEIKKFRRKFMDFITNKKVKVLKNNNGDIRMIKVKGNPNIKFNNETAQIVADVDFEWIEVGDATNIEQLKRTGLL